MPIDPSIISNAFANASNNMPDVNALMQQRIQGAENIYKIEAGRQEQAAQAEKEAAQQAAEAMLPAVASAFSDPSDNGLDAATSMLPPEVAQAFTPFMQRLKRIPDVKQRMAILRAELAKDDEGRYILGQLEPTANMQLQAKTAAGAQALTARDLARKEKEFERGPQMDPYQAEMLKLAKAKDAREAAKVSPEAAKQQQAVREIDTAIAKISEVAQPGNLIDMSTNSIIGNLLDEVVAQTSGGLITLPGDVAAAQMEVIAHLARMAVPRFEGPQGEKDAAIYERASGQLSSPTTSNTTKRAAAQTVVELLNARRDQFEFSGENINAGANEDSGVLEYDENGNLIE
jgi:hypothetical protein